jgi:hypothetical protein
MGIVLVYDVEVFEGENEDKLVFAVSLVRGHRVDGKSLYTQGIAVLVPEEST